MNESRDSADRCNLNRRLFSCRMLAGAGAIVGGPALLQQAHAAEFTIKLGHNTPITFGLNIRAREAAERIRKETKERVNIQIFPNTQLGSDPDMFGQVRSGAIQMHLVPCLLVQNVIADSGVHGVAFAFKDYAAVWSAMDGDLGNNQRKAMRSIGLHALDTAWDNGFRQITTSKKAVSTPADLVGLKMRVPAFPMNVSIFESLGAAPTSVNIKETYAALQTGLVDGQENPLHILELMKWFEVQKYCTVTNHLWDGYWLSINQKYWDSLPVDLQQIIERNFNEAAKAQRVDNEALDKHMQADLAKKGIVFIKPDLESFRGTLRKAGYYDKWRKAFSPEAWNSLEKYAGKLG